MKIYKIIDNTNGNIYIGKTTQSLKRRLSHHKSHKNCSSREIIKNRDYRIELIEETDDESRERYWIENSNCINEQIPGRTDKEYYRDNKDKIQEYQRKKYEKNKEKKKDNMREYRKYRISIGGDPRYDNNLLKIDIDLFII